MLLVVGMRGAAVPRLQNVNRERASVASLVCDSLFDLEDRREKDGFGTAKEADLAGESPADLH